MAALLSDDAGCCSIGITGTGRGKSIAVLLHGGYSDENHQDQCKEGQGHIPFLNPSLPVRQSAAHQAVPFWFFSIISYSAGENIDNFRFVQ